MNAQIHINIPEKGTKLTLREYQKRAHRALIDFTKNLIRKTLERDNAGEFLTASLLEMATGSGKTFTIGKYIEILISMRDRMQKKLGVETPFFPNLNILVLTNRIDGLEQFRDDLIHGRAATGNLSKKEPIISSSVRENIVSKTFHSKADNLDDLDPSYFTYDETEEVEGTGNNQGQNNLFFSTYQTAYLKDLANILPYIDIIVIDEAHNVRGDNRKSNDFKKLLNQLVQKGRDGYPPQIIPITATPSNITKTYFGEPIFTYGLCEYLASPFSPNVAYKLRTANHIDPEHIEKLRKKFTQAKEMKNIREKKELLKEIVKEFDEMMMDIPDTQTLVSDVLTEIQGDNEGKITETIIFAKDITEANDIAKEINKVYGREISLPYHSKSKQNKALSRLADNADDIKIVIAVDMLNESIDLPVVSNVVFWRGTDLARIFLQQFGRGLRGNGIVRYYDYVGNTKNFAWIGAIHEEFERTIESPQPPRPPTGGIDKPIEITLNTGIQPTGFEGTSSLEGKEEIPLGESSPISDNSIDIVNVLENEEIGIEGIKSGEEENIGNLSVEVQIIPPSNRQKFQIIGGGLYGTSHDIDIFTTFGLELADAISEKIELTREEIVKYFKENKSLEEYKKYNTKQRIDIEIFGYGLHKIASVFDIEAYRISNKVDWYILLGSIFNTNLVYEKEVNITKEEVFRYFQSNGSLEEWKRKTNKERGEIKINGNGLNKIASFIGGRRKERNGGHKDILIYRDAWYDLLEVIFETKIVRSSEK